MNREETTPLYPDTNVVISTEATAGPGFVISTEATAGPGFVISTEATAGSEAERP